MQKLFYVPSDLEETNYVTPPPVFKDKIGERKVLKLKKNIYGLPQSGRR